MIHTKTTSGLYKSNKIQNKISRMLLYIIGKLASVSNGHYQKSRIEIKIKGTVTE